MVTSKCMFFFIFFCRWNNFSRKCMCIPACSYCLLIVIHVHDWPDFMIEVYVLFRHDQNRWLLSEASAILGKFGCCSTWTCKYGGDFKHCIGFIGTLSPIGVAIGSLYCRGYRRCKCYRLQLCCIMRPRDCSCTVFVRLHANTRHCQWCSGPCNYPNDGEGRRRTTNDGEGQRRTANDG